MDKELVKEIFEKADILNVDGTELEKYIGEDEVVIALGKRLFIVKFTEVKK